MGVVCPCLCSLLVEYPRGHLQCALFVFSIILSVIIDVVSVSVCRFQVLFDADGVLKQYESPEAILQEFYSNRLNVYNKRKSYLEGMLDAEARKLSNQAKFILEKIENKIVIGAFA